MDNGGERPGGLYLGVDTGGTFTDLVLMDADGQIATAKASTTPGRLDVGVLEAVRLVAEQRGETTEQLLSQVAVFGHGTTQATNALIERKGARTGLITTRGFGDTIFIQRLLGFTAGKAIDELGWYSRRHRPEPIVPPALVKEVPERIDRDGRILIGLDDDAARRAITDLLADGVEALAISLLWSFRNPVHERRLAEIVRQEAGDGIFLTLSSDVIPVIGEYERTATTVLNSYLGPVVDRYVQRLEAQLRDQGFRGTFTVLNSIGGVVTAAEAARRAVLLLTSGPTGGLIGSRFLADALGHDNVITADMGGTSFDVGLIINRHPQVSAVTEVAQYHVASPIINITAVGSGGGSIASVHDGLITVGPESAGADPGPVAYGRGGTRPTVTDADLVLGYLDPEAFLGGRMRLDVDAASAAIDRHIAQPLGLTMLEAAAGIRQIVDSQMADTLRELTIEKGHDPRDFHLYAYGGAGPLHCATFGPELGLQQIVVPATSMVHSAYGALASDVQVAAQRSVSVRDALWDAEGAAEMDALFTELETECRAAVAANDAGAEVELSRSVDMRFRRQAHELHVPVNPGPIGEATLEPLIERFGALYEEAYGRGAAFLDAGIEITALRVAAVGRTRKPRLVRHAPAPDGTGGPRRQVFDVTMGRHVDAAVVTWSALEAGARIDGPALVCHPTTTVYAGPNQDVGIDDYGNLTITTRSPA